VAEPAPVQIQTSTTRQHADLRMDPATAVASGGSSPYIFAWSPIGGLAAHASNLPAGSYTISITDANGCTVLHLQSFQIRVDQQRPWQPARMLLVPALLMVPPRLRFQGNKSDYISMSPYGGNTTTASNLSGGNYTVTVSDHNGCLTFVPVTNPGTTGHYTSDKFQSDQLRWN